MMANHLIRYKNLEQDKKVIAFSTTKNPLKPLDFSFALHTGEDKTLILQNRKNLKSEHLKGFKFVVLSQIHSDKVIKIDKVEDIGWHQPSHIQGDAIITNKTGVALGILTADCVPVMLFDPTNEAIANIHSGWRGTSSNIIKKTIKQMQKEYNTDPADLIVALGASIRGCCYEVGNEVAKEFLNYPEALQKRGDKFLLDVALICKKELLELGVEEANISISSDCTSCQNNRFFSYRKDKTSGRFISLIALKPRL
jgi:YfiH family protein